ncbi:MAG TPA: cysteine desulfurase family protein [Victivallales bacterium]|nr:cysteine desulfurase family protein [Victivallales bacterium]HRU00365.1 cysteine desulfurase family protein [Victivallales bacterium]
MFKSSKKEKIIYLDHNATTPCFPEVINTMLPFFVERSANPSSPHYLGRESAYALEKAREMVAKFINASPEEIIFNSGGTEGNNHAITKGIEIRGKTEIICSEIEHSSVLSICKNLQNKNIKVTYIPCDKDGIVRTELLAKIASDNTSLISVMFANNETGAIQPVREIADIARKKGIIFHCDAVQAAGKVKIDVKELGVDLLTLSGHKFYGPKGVGVLYIRKGIKLPPLLFGGGQERRLRPGTENIPAIIGLAKACELAESKLTDFQEHCLKLRNLLIGELKQISGIRINTPLEQSVCNTLNISFKDVNSEALVTRLDIKGICVSSASACAGLTKFSHVLKAMNLPEEYLYSSIRVSLGFSNTVEDIFKTASIIRETVEEIRKLRL